VALSEARYRALFESLDAGFCEVELKFEEDGRAVDYRFLEVNPAFERQTGLIDATGRWMRELAPEHEQHWFDNYGRVALTGESIRFENEATRWDIGTTCTRFGSVRRRRGGSRSCSTTFPNAAAPRSSCVG
jgi:PAS domain S-box-containing protein